MKITSEWAAGFIEGDGCFTTTRSSYKGKQYCYPTIKVSQKNHEPLYAMRSLFGGSVSSYESGGKRWWSCSGSKALLAYSEIKHLMSDKRYGQALAAGFPVTKRETPESLDWFAGLYEAEGCAILRSNSDPTYKYPTIIVTQYYSDQILKWSRKINSVGSVTGPHHAGFRGYVAYSYRVNGGSAVDLARSLYGLVSKEKKKQIENMVMNSTLGRGSGVVPV